MELGDLVQRLDERAAGRREEYRAPLHNRRPFLVAGRRRGRRRRRVLLAVGVLVLLATGSTIARGGRSTQVPLDRVVERFRAEQVAPAAASVPAARTNDLSSAPGRREVPPAAAEANTGRPDADRPYVLPESGVYTYRATGGERLSIFGAEHRYPERVHATVRHLGGCAWEGRIDVIEEHVDTMQLCSAPGRLTLPTQTRTVEFFGVRQSIKIDCDPAIDVHASEDRPGSTRTFSCTDGADGTVSVKRTFVGPRDVLVGDERLEALHIHLDSRFEEGRFDGRSIDDVWVSPVDGSPYRWKRSVDVQTGALFGPDARYTEEADFVLESVEPRR